METLLFLQVVGLMFWLSAVVLVEEEVVVVEAEQVGLLPLFKNIFHLEHIL
jgi:hypothetical protein